MSNWTARNGSARWIGSLIALLGLMSLAARGQSSASSDVEENRERIVIFTSGRILTGQVSRSAGGYLVEQPNRRIWIQDWEVKFVVNDLHEAYCKHRDSITVPTAEIHLALANWCVSNNLFDEARDEVKKCLKIKPENKAAGLLLERLSKPVRAIPPPEVESLGGLSHETSTEFTSKIQPLLLNKCGTAACHGTTSSNGFRLVGARAGGNGSRHSTERNLAEAIKYIDLQAVANSPLVSVPKNGHGGNGTIFGDPSGVKQLKMLKTWSQTAAEEMQRKEKQR